jgi:hypothetical protein
MARMVTAAQFAEIVSNRSPEEGGVEVGAHAVRKWFRLGLVDPPAQQEEKGKREWMVDANAKVLAQAIHRGVRDEMGYTPRQWAQHLGVSRSSVHTWLRKGEVPEAEKWPEGWYIPKYAIDPRKRKARARAKAAKASTSANAEATLKAEKVVA